MRTFEIHPLRPQVAVCRQYFDGECAGCPLMEACTVPLPRPHTVDDIRQQIAARDVAAREVLTGGHHVL